MRYILLLASCFFSLSWIQAQNKLPYTVKNSDESIEVRVYQTRVSREWRAVCIKNNSVVWKIKEFPHDGDRNHTYVSKDGRVLVQLIYHFETPQDVVMRTWQNGEMVWDFHFEELNLPEEVIIKLKSKNTWFIEAEVIKGKALLIMLNGEKKLPISLATGTPATLPLAKRFRATFDSDFLSMLTQSGTTSTNPNELLFGGKSVSKELEKELKSQLPFNLMNLSLKRFGVAGKLELKEFYDAKREIYHPDTLVFLVLRFCRTVFTPKEMAEFKRVKYTYDRAKGYYIIAFFPKLPYSVKFQTFINPAFFPGKHKEKVYQILRVTTDGKIFGAYMDESETKDDAKDDKRKRRRRERDKDK